MQGPQPASPKLLSFSDWSKIKVIIAKSRSHSSEQLVKV